MSGAVKPFEHIKKPISGKGIASVKYVERRLREVLGKLHFTGSVKTSADGQIHIDGGSGDGLAGDYPFKIEASGAGIILGPGYVSMTGNLGYGIVKINGLPITPPQNANNWSPPILALPVGISNIVLEIVYTPKFDSQDIYGVPINYITGATLKQDTVNVRAYSSVPNDVGSRINYPEGSAEEGTCYVRIGQVNKANTGSLTVLAQDWRNNIAASPQGDGYVFLAAK